MRVSLIQIRSRVSNQKLWHVRLMPIELEVVHFNGRLKEFVNYLLRREIVIHHGLLADLQLTFDAQAFVSAKPAHLLSD